jgi:hypothetical protein
MQVVVGEQITPLRASKHPINLRESGVTLLVTPSIEPALEVKFIELQILKKSSKLPH